jgi:hypothetical protein
LNWGVAQWYATDAQFINRLLGESGHFRDDPVLDQVDQVAVEQVGHV